MNKRTSIISVVVAFLLLLVATGATAQDVTVDNLIAGSGIVREIEIDNFMPAAESYCYNSQVQASNPGEKISLYRLDILAQSFSTNGRISGLEAGFKARGVTCSGMAFVNKIPDWKPQLERELT